MREAVEKHSESQFGSSISADSKIHVVVAEQIRHVSTYERNLVTLAKTYTR
jgi:hypothetical protein